MNDVDAFSEYRQVSPPYLPEQGQTSRPSSLERKVSSQATQGHSQGPPSVQRRNTPARMPKAQALALLRKVKRGIVLASFLGFGTFSALVMSHTASATTQKATTVTTTTQVATPATTATKKTTTATSASTTTQKAATAAAVTTTTIQTGEGYGFGSSNSTSQPVSGTHTS